MPWSWLRTRIHRCRVLMPIKTHEVQNSPIGVVGKLGKFVEFREELLTSTPKHSSHPELLRQQFHHSEIHSLQRTKLNLTWRNPPAHHWYAAKSPGLSLQCRSSRAHQTALARIKSGHLRSMTFVQGVKSFFICPCSLPASPAHLLDFWGISLRQLFEDQDLVCDTILRKGQIDLMDLKLDLVKNGLDNVLQGNWKQQQSCSL
ncbi:uncharacterized protein TNCV_2041111 [Trichonephila clavipes]|nr:uncharacterized protein TNCV_2041111 [Trichonephila clavipes]